MAPKKPSPSSQEEEKNNGVVVPRSKRGYKEVNRRHSVERYTFLVESMLRRPVRDEVEKTFYNYYACLSSRPMINQIKDGVRFQLHFQNRPPHTLYTGKKIKGNDKMPIQIAITDVKNQIVAYGPVSSLKIKVVVVKGDFNRDGEPIWSQEEFNRHIVSERHGKRPLLTGELDIKLQHGVGCIHDASFTDKSRSTWSGKFRLGALVPEGGYAGERVQEAITEPFRVKDDRVEAFQKDCPPSLNDEVFRLKKIKKDGPLHVRLKDNGIYTVQDFLRANVMDPTWLRSLLGRGMPNKWWEVTVKHASQCLLDDKLYSYRVVGQGTDLVFNSIFELLGVEDSGHYYPVHNLPEIQKEKVNCFRKLAYQNRGNIVEDQDSAVERIVASVQVSPVPDQHNPNHLATFQSASFDEVSDDILRFQEADIFRVSSDICDFPSDPGPSTSLIPRAQVTYRDEVANHESQQVVSSRQGFICLQHSASFAASEFGLDTVSEQNQGVQYQLEDPGMSEEQVTLWVRELLQSPVPPSPRKWAQLTAVLRLVSVSKKSARNKAISRQQVLVSGA